MVFHVGPINFAYTVRLAFIVFFVKAFETLSRLVYNEGFLCLLYGSLICFNSMTGT